MAYPFFFYSVNGPVVMVMLHVSWLCLGYYKMQDSWAVYSSVVYLLMLPSLMGMPAAGIMLVVCVISLSMGSMLHKTRAGYAWSHIMLTTVVFRTHHDLVGWNVQVKDVLISWSPVLIVTVCSPQPIVLLVSIVGSHTYGFC